MYVVFACDTEAEASYLSDIWSSELQSNWGAITLPPQAESLDEALSKMAPSSDFNLGEVCGGGAGGEMKKALDAMQLATRCENTPLVVAALDGWTRCEGGEAVLSAALQLPATIIDYPSLVSVMLSTLERIVGVLGAAEAARAAIAGDLKQHPWFAPLLPLHRTVVDLIKSLYPTKPSVPVQSNLPQVWSELADLATAQQNAAAEVLCRRAIVECLRRSVDGADSMQLGASLWRLSAATRRSGKSGAEEAKVAHWLGASAACTDASQAQLGAACFSQPVRLCLVMPFRCFQPCCPLLHLLFLFAAAPLLLLLHYSVVN